MPRRPAVPCRGSPLCSKPGRFRGYCEDHRGMRRAGARERPNAGQRGYDAQWQKVRKMYAKRHPLCEPCQVKGRTTPMQVVDHIIPLRAGGARLDERNLQSMCNPCHAEKTERDKGLYPEAYGSS